MKLFGREIHLRTPPATRHGYFLSEKLKGKVENNSGSYGARTFNPGEHSWRDRCRYYDSLFDKHGLAKSIATTIAGQLMAEGVFNIENDLIHDKASPKASDAKNEVDLLNRDTGIEPMLYDAAINVVKHGSVFFEQDLDSWDIRLIPFQECIEPKAQDDTGEITDWRQVFNNVEKAAWNVERKEIIHVGWNITSQSWPYGTSLYTGLDVDFDTLQQLKLDIKEFMHNNAFPMEIYAIGDGEFMPTDADLGLIRSMVKVMQPGQKMVTSYPIDHKVGGTGDREVKGIDTVLPFLKDEIIDGGGIPPISKQYNATQASAKEMMPQMMANYIIPLQRIFSRVFEECRYKPYLESLGYSVRLCPRMEFTNPDAHKVEDAQYWQALIGAGLPAEYAWEEMGFDLEKIQELQEEKDKRMLEQQKLQQALNPQGNDANANKPFQKKEEKPQEQAKEFEEWTVRKRKAA